ncbi:MAG: carbonic anhydrase [Deltaproteobacteria bacterium]|nr:carbonic anhydrase [Deltaproteobacteria bacterium]
MNRQFKLKGKGSQGRGKSRRHKQSDYSLLLPIVRKEDLPEEYRHTAIEDLLLYHNLNYPFDSYNRVEMLVLTCIDHRIMLNLPNNFSYIIRNSGAKIDNVKFAVSFAVAVAKIKTIALIGHMDCMMLNIERHKTGFIKGLEEQGWKRHRAEKFFKKMQPVFGIKNVVRSLIDDAAKLRSWYPKTLIVPVCYSEKEKKLYLVKEDRA